MSEMGDWFAQLGSQGAFTIPEQGGGVMPRVPAPPPAEDTTRTQPAPPTPTAPDQTRTPDAAAPPPPEAGPPAAPISAPLRMYLLQQLSGHNIMTPEMYQLYGGDEILQQVQKFDPNARWTATEMGGGEGATSTPGMRLDFDPRLIPALQTPASAPQNLTWRPVYDNESLRVQEMQYNDPLYGAMTPLQNKYKAQDPWWTYAAPIAISAFAPMAAGALAAGGIGAGAAGAGYTTAAVTGSGLAANAAQQFAASPWWAKALATKGIPLAGKIGSGLTQGAAPPITPPVHTSTGDYNPMAYNRAGSSPAPNSSDSSLVATQFADDPYGMSRGRG